MASAREKIRQAALELFAENGYAATATREICERAGVTKPVLYYHFQSKDQLYRRLIDEAHEEAGRVLAEAAAKGKTAEERLVSFLEADFHLARENRELVSILLREVFAPRGGTPDIDCVRMAEIWLGLVQGILEDGIHRGQMHCKPRDMAEAVMGVRMIHVMRFVLTGEPPLDRKLARKIVRLLISGCGPTHKEHTV